MSGAFEENDGASPYPPLLAGVRVLDISHQYSGALAASLLADLGAEVVAVEHPSRVAIRTMLPRKGEESLWWKVVGRGKRDITLNLNSDEGRAILLGLAKDFDVLIENFRPGTLEKWGLGPAELEASGCRLVMLRISGFGQTGPLRGKPGFGTIAEAMSGFAYLNGEEDGSPIFPSTTLADGVAAVFGAFGVAAALASRHKGNPAPPVEVVDMALFEGLFRIIPTQVPGFDQLGLVPRRPGNKLTSHGVLRNLYATRDSRYFVVSAVGGAAIRRIVCAIGADDLVAEIDADVMVQSPDRILAFLDECDGRVADWALQHDFDFVEKRMHEFDAVFQRIYNVEDIVSDEHYGARGDLVRVWDDVLGEVLMQGVVPKFHSRRHEVGWAGPRRGRDNEEIYKGQLGLTDPEYQRLRDEHVI